MVKESNMAIFSFFLVFVVVFCNIMKLFENKLLMILALVAVTISIISLLLSLSNKKKNKAKMDKYIFAIIISIISIVFNLFLFVSLILFSFFK